MKLMNPGACVRLVRMGDRNNKPVPADGADQQTLIEKLLADCDREIGRDGSDPLVHALRGDVLASLSRYGEALESYDRALQIDAGIHEVHDGRAVALYGLGRYGEALEAIDEAIRLTPQEGGYHEERGSILLALEQQDGALGAFDDAADANEGQTPRISLMRGVTLTSLGRCEEAAASFAQAVELEPGHAGYGAFKAMGLLVAERYEEAVAAFDEALILEPADAGLHFERARALEKLGRLAEALASCRRAIELDPRERVFRKWRQDLFKPGALSTSDDG